MFWRVAIEIESTPFVVNFAQVDAQEAYQLAAAAEKDDEEPEEKSTAPVKGLESEAVQKLLSRAEPIKNEEGDVKNFAMRGE